MSDVDNPATKVDHDPGIELAAPEEDLSADAVVRPRVNYIVEERSETD